MIEMRKGSSDHNLASLSLKSLLKMFSFTEMTPKLLVQKMRAFESRAVTGENPHSYIVGNTSVEARLSRNISELPLKSRYGLLLACWSRRLTL